MNKFGGIRIRYNYMKKTHCYYCECPLTEENFTKDHIVPKSKGGKWKHNNIVPCCKACNKEKGDKTIPEYILFLTLRQPNSIKILNANRLL